MAFWYSAYANIQVTIVYAKQLLIIYLFVFLSSEERVNDDYCCGGAKPWPMWWA